MSVLELPLVLDVAPRRVVVNLVMNYDADQTGWSLRDSDNNVYHLAPAPQTYQTRFDRDLSNISPFQLSKNPYHLSFVDPLQVSEEGRFTPNYLSVFSGNTRALILEAKAEDNITRFMTIVNSGSDEDLARFMESEQWTFDPIVLEFLSEEDLSDPKRLLRFSVIKNQTAEMTALDWALSYHNAYERILEDAKVNGRPRPSEGEIKKEIASEFGKTDQNLVNSYLNLYDWSKQSEMDSWIEALKSDVVKLTVLSRVVTLFNKLDKKYDHEISRLHFYNLCYEQAQKQAKDDYQPRITGAIVEEVMQGVIKTLQPLEAETEDGSIDSDGTDDDLSNQTGSEKSAAALEKERISNLSNEEIHSETPESIERLLAKINSITSLELPQFMDLNDVLVNVKSQLTEFKVAQWKSVLKFVSELDMQIESAKSKLGNQADLTTDKLSKILVQHNTNKETEAQKAAQAETETAEVETVEALASEAE